MYAKLYGPPEDQIVVQLGLNAEGTPEVKCYFKPRGLGVCSKASSFSMGLHGEAAARAAFDQVSEEAARTFIRDAREMAESMTDNLSVSEPFAKLYGNDVDQILVMLNVGGGDEPEVRFHVQPEGEMLRSFAASFEDDDSGAAKAQATFDNVTGPSARAYVTSALSMESIARTFDM